MPLEEEHPPVIYFGRARLFLSNGEYVLRADEVRHYGLSMLDALNARRPDVDEGLDDD